MATDPKEVPAHCKALSGDPILSPRAITSLLSKALFQYCIPHRLTAGLGSVLWADFDHPASKAGSSSQHGGGKVQLETHLLQHSYQNQQREMEIPSKNTLPFNK